MYIFYSSFSAFFYTLEADYKALSQQRPVSHSFGFEHVKLQSSSSQFSGQRSSSVPCSWEFSTAVPDRGQRVTFHTRIQTLFLPRPRGYIHSDGEQGQLGVSKQVQVEDKEAAKYRQRVIQPAAKQQFQNFSYLLFMHSAVLVPFSALMTF